MQRLLIVESPTKAGKIRGFLGPGWRVEASMGHVRDLPAQGGLAVAFQDGRVLPHYEPLEKAGQSIARLRAAARAADEIWLATDPDREGEAISFHVAALLGDGKPMRRVVFHAITKAAVLKAISEPRDIDRHLVDAQQARRVLDRVVGWAVSPTLRRCGKEAKSAGRVQSVALRLVVDRENEILAFTAEDYHLLTATLEGPVPPPFTARLFQWKGEPIGHRLGDPAVAAKTVDWCRRQPWIVQSCERSERRVQPPAPFTTASVQQAASVALKLSPKQTMTLLQQLFEAGHITYHRTDSTHLEPEAVAMARAVIQQRHPDCLPKAPIVHGTKNANAQEAHEAIRPTHAETGPDAVPGEGGALYALIWTRFIACQMAPGRDAVAVIDAAVAPGTWNGGPMGVFRAKGVVRLFDGWRRLGRPAEDEKPRRKAGDAPEDEQEGELPALNAGDALTLRDLTATRHTTKPPPRYTLASLIKRLERDGIGRPSTYEPTVSVLLFRTYIREEKRMLHATPLGRTVIAFLVRAYAGDFIEYDYTKRMEGALDRIAAGEDPWEPLVTKASRRTVDLALAAGLMRDPLIAG